MKFRKTKIKKQLGFPQFDSHLGSFISSCGLAYCQSKIKISNKNVLYIPIEIWKIGLLKFILNLYLLFKDFFFKLIFVAFYKSSTSSFRIVETA